MTEAGGSLGEKYEILRQIGQGGMATVYLAKERRSGRYWAAKAIEKNSENWCLEAALMKKLTHPGLPQITEVIETETTVWMIMEYIKGIPLSQILETEGAQNQSQVAAWGMQLCGILNYLHTCVPPVIYRDMKPANIMIKPDKTVSLIDFGIAREYKEQKNRDTEHLGTRGYAAPEQFAGKGQTDARTDIYGLGVTLYHAVTGHSPCEPPFEKYPICVWNAELSPGLEEIIAKCTRENPKERYQTVLELWSDLECYELLDEEVPQKQRKKIWRPKRTLLAGVILLTIAGSMAEGPKGAKMAQDKIEAVVQIIQCQISNGMEAIESLFNSTKK